MTVESKIGRKDFPETFPKTGITSKEPLKTLATFRNRNGNILFGQNMILHIEGTIRVGDKIKLIDS